MIKSDFIYIIYSGADFADPDSSDNYPLHYAAAYGFDECIDLLIKAGANPNVKNTWKVKIFFEHFYLLYLADSIMCSDAQKLYWIC